MAKAILLNSNFEEDVVFPEKLAKLAKLAYVAAAKGDEKFTEPDSEAEYEVDKLEVYDYALGRMTTVVGVSVPHENLLWQCWHAGDTVKGREYFRFRAYTLCLAPVDNRGRILDEPLVAATGQIFHNSDRSGDRYDMQLTDCASAAELKLARRLIQDGVPVEKILAASELLTRSELENTNFSRGGRTSGVVLS